MRKILVLAAALVAAASLSACATLSKGGGDFKRLDPDVVPQRYEVRLSPHAETGDFEGVETIDLTLAHPTSEITLHAHELTISEATADGGVPAKVSLDTGAETATLSFAHALAGPTAKLRITWKGRLRDDSEGIYRAKDHDRWYVMTHFEPTYARRMIPCFDEPALKAVYKLSVEVD